MHPAPSIIVFTALSGLGFGLMVYLGIDPPEKGGWVTGVFALLALALAGIGLLASTFHLGHPERALKAFSQWRTSWLSREGVAAVAAMGVFALYAALATLGGGTPQALGWLAAALALVTIFCTAMIYAQLRSVPRWNTPLTPALFALYALTGGALLAGKIGVSAWFLALLGAAQLYAWYKGDGALAASGSTMETATGLGPLGTVRLLEAPHSGPNYLLREMVYKIGRKHARKLRLAALLFAVVLPLAIALFAHPGHILGTVMVLSHLLGLFISRWLFFAEAEHVVGLYYGAR